MSTLASLSFIDNAFYKILKSLFLFTSNSFLFQTLFFFFL